MSTENNCTVTFKWPLPAPVLESVDAIFLEQVFGEDWDAPAVNLHKWQPPKPGVVSFFARDVTLATQDTLLALAKTYKFSIIIHAEWCWDCEGDVTGAIMAYDATDGRSVATWATNNSAQPVISLREALRLSKEELQQKYGLPKDLTEET